MPEHERNADHSRQTIDAPKTSSAGNARHADHDKPNFELIADSDHAVREPRPTTEAVRPDIDVDSVGPQSAGGAMMLFDHTSHEEASGYQEPRNRDPVSTMQLLREPMLAIIAVVAIGAASWNYLKLNEARMALSAASSEVESARSEKFDAAEAKLSAEKTLAVAKNQLTKLEKTVRDIEMAIAASGLTAVSAGTAAAKPGEESGAGGAASKKSEEQPNVGPNTEKEAAPPSSH